MIHNLQHQQPTKNMLNVILGCWEPAMSVLRMPAWIHSAATPLVHLLHRVRLREQNRTFFTHLSSANNTLY